MEHLWWKRSWYKKWLLATEPGKDCYKFTPLFYSSKRYTFRVLRTQSNIKIQCNLLISYIVVLFSFTKGRLASLTNQLNSGWIWFVMTFLSTLLDLQSIIVRDLEHVFYCALSCSKRNYFIKKRVLKSPRIRIVICCCRNNNNRFANRNK